MERAEKMEDLGSTEVCGTKGVQDDQALPGKDSVESFPKPLPSWEAPTPSPVVDYSPPELTRR
jgi:hypothetical protein